jgi:3-oxoacyl-(acyl-carrier-protein) synthase
LIAQKIMNKGILYACLAGVEAWKDAGLERNKVQPDFDSGMVMGAGDLSFDSYRKGEYPFYLVDRGESRKLGSRIVSESMNSGGAAYLNSILGLGNRILSNSSACITGSEAVLLGYEHIALGKAKRMLCGSTEGDGRYIWSAFDAMRVLCADSNDQPDKGSRPMSHNSAGFVPSGGSGALVLESLDSAIARGANIYAEILGGHVNSGGLRDGGSMTAPNPGAVVQCITKALENAEIAAEEIDLINGHLTSTMGDPLEIKCWKDALKLNEQDFPLVNTPKSMIGHGIAGAGSIELVGSLLQMDQGFVHANFNLTEDSIHPKIADQIPIEKIPLTTFDHEVNTIVKANFGFGDINCCLVLRKFEES